MNCRCNRKIKVLKRKNSRREIKMEKNRMTNSGKEDWIEFGKEEGENWIKNMSNDAALKVASMASDFDDAEEILNRQDNYQYDNFKNDFRCRFREFWSVLNKTEAPDSSIEEFEYFKQGWIEAVREFARDIIIKNQ